MSGNLQSTERSEVLRKLNDIANWVTSLRGEVGQVLDYILDQQHLAEPVEVDE